MTRNEIFVETVARAMLAGIASAIMTAADGEFSISEGVARAVDEFDSEMNCYPGRVHKERESEGTVK